MKQSIAWHQECLKNSKSSLERYKKEMELAIMNFLDCKKCVEFAEMQINSAIAEGKDGFDNERYKVAKVKP